MKPVIQLEKTGCGLASCAALAGISYARARQVANSIGIYADDPSLWSDTAHVRQLLEKLGISAGPNEIPFSSWQTLPDRALLAIKWHLEKSRPFWHWVVFLRQDGSSHVLDSKPSLKHHIRTDFGRMHPKWYIHIEH